MNLTNFKKISDEQYSKLTYTTKHNFTDMSDEEIDTIINYLEPKTHSYLQVHKSGLRLSTLGEWNGVSFFIKGTSRGVGQALILKLESGEFIMDLNLSPGREDETVYYIFDYKAIVTVIA